MARLALTLGIVLLAVPAHAGRLSLQLGLGTGVGWARRAGVYRDDVISILRIGGEIDALYVRGELAVVGASHLGSNYDVLASIGRWGQLTPWLAWYGEVGSVVRLGEVSTGAARIDLGVAFTY